MYKIPYDMSTKERRAHTTRLYRIRKSLQEGCPQKLTKKPCYDVKQLYYQYGLDADDYYIGTGIKANGDQRKYMREYYYKSSGRVKPEDRKPEPEPVIKKRWVIKSEDFEGVI